MNFNGLQISISTAASNLASWQKSVPAESLSLNFTEPAGFNKSYQHSNDTRGEQNLS